MKEYCLRQSPRYGEVFSFFFFNFIYSFIFLLTITKSGFEPGLVDLLRSQTHREFRAYHSLGWILVCAYTICYKGQISILLHNSLWITFPTQSYLVLYSLCGGLLHKLFRFYRHITYICYSVVSYLFLLWHNWSLWRCFLLLSEDIQLLS